MRQFPWKSFPWKLPTLVLMGFSGGSDGEESACSVGDLGLIPRLGRSPGRGHGSPPQYSCMENPLGQRSLVGYSPCSPKELDTTERLSIARHIEAVAVISNSLSFFLVVQLPSCVQLFEAPWTAARRLPCPSLSRRVCSNSCPLSRMLSNHLILCRPLLSSVFGASASGSFSTSCLCIM